MRERERERERKKEKERERVIVCGARRLALPWLHVSAHTFA